MPVLANDGSSFRVHHRSSAMTSAPLASADADPISTDPDMPQSAQTGRHEAAGKLHTADQGFPQSSMPVLEASHRGSLILTVFLEPRTGRFRVRPSEEVLQFSEADYAAVIRAVRC